MSMMKRALALRCPGRHRYNQRWPLPSLRYAKGPGTDGSAAACNNDLSSSEYCRIKQDVIPDIVTLAKGIGNGAPLAAVITTPDIARALADRIHFNTFGGNPVSCAMGKAVLEVIDRENLQKNSLKIGGYLIEGLERLMSRHDLIGDVRGRGLMTGIELVKDRKTKEPAKDECAQVLERSKEMGLLIGRGGFYGNVLRIKPPMCITREDVDFIIGVLDTAFGEL